MKIYNKAKYEFGDSNKPTVLTFQQRIVHCVHWWILETHQPLGWELELWTLQQKPTSINIYNACNDSRNKLPGSPLTCPLLQPFAKHRIVAKPWILATDTVPIAWQTTVAGWRGNFIVVISNVAYWRETDAFWTWSCDRLCFTYLILWYN